MEESMKRNAIVPILYALLGMLHLVAFPSEANDHIKQRTLKLQPKADTDEDGVLSDAEKLRLLERGEARRKQKTDAGRSSVSSPMTNNSTASGITQKTSGNGRTSRAIQSMQRLKRKCREGCPFTISHPALLTYRQSQNLFFPRKIGGPENLLQETCKR